uniref:Roadblock/LAMTOR2 domain-containing protein n=1 Tax=Coturnix japonica TaxID=93934 RepID=A0A8C2Y5Z4_COTJA
MKLGLRRAVWSCVTNILHGQRKAEVEETLKRIQSQKGVQGIIVVNSEGIPIESTMDNTTTIQYAGLMHSFIMKARSTVRDIDPQNDLTFLQIRSKKNEIMFAPGALPAAGAEQEED